MIYLLGEASGQSVSRDSETEAPTGGKFRKILALNFFSLALGHPKWQFPARKHDFFRWLGSGSYKYTRELGQNTDRRIYFQFVGSTAG